MALAPPNYYKAADENVNRRQDSEDIFFKGLLDVPFLANTVLLDVTVSAAPGDVTVDHGLGYKAQGFFVVNLVQDTPAGASTPARYTTPVSPDVDNETQMTLYFNDVGTYTLLIF